MRYKKITIILLLTLYPAPIFATDWDFLSVHGYGTIGGAYQDNDEVLFRDSYHADKGTQGEFSFANYSILGLHLGAKVSDRLTFTLQGAACVNNENDKLLDIEWANVKYQFSDDFDIRVGVMRTDTFMFSDILNVAYYYDSIRLPDMYHIIPFNKYNGVELSHRLNFNDLSIFSRLLYGQTKTNTKPIRDGQMSKVDIDIHAMYGVALKFLYHDLSLRMAYHKINLTVDNSNIKGVLSQFNATAIPSILETIQKYQIEDTYNHYYNIGARYNFSNSYLIAEYIKMDSNSFLPDVASWNIRTGYNFETWTPFIGYSQIKSNSNYKAISTAGVPTQMAGAITSANQAFSTLSINPDMDLETCSLGFRYDLSDNMLFKLQYDNQKRVEERLDVFSMAINFIF